MWTETRRPRHFRDIVGHTEIKEALRSYVTSTPPYRSAIVLTGSPGIGKTTLALAVGETFGFDVTELNAGKSLRSYADVDSLKDASRSSISVSSLLRGERKRICLVLDEIDGSDPHAQRRLSEWLSKEDLAVPVICTCNEVPALFKKPRIQILRCFPPSTADIQTLFPGEDGERLAVECKHDIRTILQRLQYGTSDTLPAPLSQSLKWSPEVCHWKRQKTWTEIEPIRRAS
jgi:replication-associated recombination protein RarA